MMIIHWIIDGLLTSSLLWIAWCGISARDLFKAIVLFIAFGLIMVLVWIRLNAPDVALAEAAIGTGLTGALLLAALKRLELKAETNDKRMAEVTFSGSLETTETPTLFTRLILIAWLMGLTSWLAYAVLSLPNLNTGLLNLVNEHLPSSGVHHPITAVLLNFRGYDTLLEMSVLLIALAGTWSLSLPSVRIEAEPGPVLNFMTRVLIPLMFMVSAYLLWIGAKAPGGAFQAGSVLAASGVLLLLSGWRLPSRYTGWPLRAVSVLGLLVFIATGAAMLLIGNLFLEFPPTIAGSLILFIEASATLSIGMTLTALFMGSQP